MDRKGSGLWFVVAAAVFGGAFTILPGRAASTAEPTIDAGHAASSSRPVSTAARPPAHSAIAILNEYLCGHDSPDCAAYRDAKNGKYSIDTMIATVPDPVESGLGSDFDDAIESIQRGAAAAGFLPDRFDLPWVPPGPGECAASSPVKTGLGETDTEVGGVTRNPESEPGLILFRDKSGTALLVLFMVGETPTAGIHKAAFIRATRQLCELRAEFPPTAAGGGYRQGPVKVMGPTYSGSAQSLELAIADARGDPHACDVDRINIISGSATAVQAEDFTHNQGVSFHAATLRGDAEIEALLKSLSGRPGEFVLLSEEGTVYGARWRWGQESQKARHRGGVTYLAFPIHIAELETAAAQQEHELNAAGVSIPALGRQNLPLTNAAQSRRDVVPLYSSSTTASLELILEELLNTVKDPQIRYVLIAATDVQDTIYLAGQVRAANPNARVIALNSHLLYLHSEFNAALRGMLVASPYPLFIEDQFWSASSDALRQPVQFPSDQAEGAYNAVVALLGHNEKLLDYGARGTAGKPPLWISVVGRNGLWPIAEIEVEDPHGYTFTAPTAGGASVLAGARLTPWTIWAFVILATAGMLAAVLASVAHARPTILPAGVAQYLGDSVFVEYRGERRIYQLEAAAIALVLLLTFAIYLLLPGAWPGTFPATSAGHGAAAHEMRIFRATHLGNGVSPLTPVLLASAAALTLLFGSIRRRVLMETHQLMTPYLGFGTDSFAGVADLEREVRRASEGDLRRTQRWWALVAATVAVYVLVVRAWRHLPLDGPLLEAMYLITSTVAYVCIASAIFRLVTLWLATRSLLHRMYWHPSRDGYATIREQLPGDKVTSIDLLASTATTVPLEAGLKYARTIDGFECDEHASAIARRLDESREKLGGAIDRTESRLKEALAAGGRGSWRAEIERRRDAERQAGAISESVAYIMEPAWRKTEAGAGTSSVSEKEEKLIDLGEAYVATRVVDFLRAVMPHLRTLAISATAAVLLMLLAASSYPFPASDDLLWFGWALVIAAAGSTTWMFASMNRDRVISLMSGTTPGAINWNSTFILQITTHALVPLLVLLGAAFPERLSRLVGWAGGLLGGHG